MPLTARWLSVLGPALLLCAFTGCEPFPISLHPLVDEKNCELDRELFGEWEVSSAEEEAITAAEAATDVAKLATGEVPKRPGRWVVGRIDGSERVHELAMLQIDDEGIIKAERMRLMMTRLGATRYATFQAKPESADGGYVITRYRFVSPHVAEVCFLDPEFIAAAIQRGDLKGSVKRETSEAPNEAGKDKLKSIRITAETAELREFFTREEKKAFQTKPTWRLQRVNSQR